MALNDSLIKSMAITLPLAGAALIADEARACGPDICSGVDVWISLQPLNAAAIPVDGVLLLRGVQTGDSPDADWLASIELAVTRDGQPIAGAIETSGVNDVLVWRPAAQLEPGATYKVSGALDNPDDVYYECGPDELLFDFEFHADAGPAAPLSPPETGAKESVVQTPLEGIEDLVCCDGAMPAEVYYGDCSGDFQIVWEGGFCTSRKSLGVLQVQLTVDSGLPAATDALVWRRLYADGQPSTQFYGPSLPIFRDEPFCTRVELTNLASGETVMSEETCHGAAVAAQLGEQPIDATDALAQSCETPAYVCAVDPATRTWDPFQCELWPGAEETGGDPTEGPTTGGPGTDGSGSDTGSDTDATDSGAQDDLVDHGCACDAAGAGPLGALGLLGLGLLRPRRRRGSSLA